MRFPNPSLGSPSVHISSLKNRLNLLPTVIFQKPHYHILQIIVDKAYDIFLGWCSLHSTFITFLLAGTSSGSRGEYCLPQLSTWRATYPFRGVPASESPAVYNHIVQQLYTSSYPSFRNGFKFFRAKRCYRNRMQLLGSPQSPFPDIKRSSNNLRVPRYKNIYLGTLYHK